MGASENIDNMIANLPDWRGKTLAEIRMAILEADTEIVEEVKFRGAPVWYRGGMICIANAYKDKVKVTFYNGASLADPDKLFNNGLGGGQWRTIDYLKDDKVKERELKNLVRSACDFNLAKVKSKTKPAAKKPAK